MRDHRCSRRRGRWARHVLPSAVFVAGWSLQTCVDYGLRLADGEVTTGGLGRDLWFQFHLAWVGVAVLVGLWANCDVALWRNALGLALQLAVGSPIYVAACLCYGIGAGIDFL